MKKKTNYITIETLNSLWKFSVCYIVAILIKTLLQLTSWGIELVPAEFV